MERVDITDTDTETETNPRLSVSEEVCLLVLFLQVAGLDVSVHGAGQLQQVDTLRLLVVRLKGSRTKKHFLAHILGLFSLISKIFLLCSIVSVLYTIAKNLSKNNTPYPEM